jgi:hypothetical protein
LKNDLTALAIMFLCFAGVVCGLIYNGDYRSLDGKGKAQANMYGFSFNESVNKKQ